MGREMNGLVDLVPQAGAILDAAHAPEQAPPREEKALRGWRWEEVQRLKPVSKQVI